MKEKVVSCLENCFKGINESAFYGTRDLRCMANGIRVFSCIDQKVAENLFNDAQQKIDEDWNLISLAYYLSAGKELGYTKSDMEEYIEMLEDQRNRRGVWNDKEIWLNSLVLKALGKYGISYPNMVDFLLKRRHPNGSWFSKVWVSSYALQGLFYSHAEPDELSLTADYIKNAIDDDHWKKEATENGWVDKEKVTSLALETLLLIGEGYEEEPVRSALNWVMDKMEETEDEVDIANLAVPLTYIVKGKAQPKTKYSKVEPVNFRETTVEIGEQYEGHKISGDLVNGDKVDEKVGKGAKYAKDGVILDKSEGGGGSGGNGSKVAKDGVLIDRSKGVDENGDTGSIIEKIKEENIDIPVNYCIFNGEEIDGVIRYCPKCGKEIEKSWKHCPSCGFEVKRIVEIFG